MNSSYIFTSESVSEGHPDKVADQISDAVVDAHMALDPEAKVACETLVAPGTVILAGEISTRMPCGSEFIKNLVSEVIRDIGYTTGFFNHKNFEFHNLLHEQSPNINQAVEKQDGQIGAGDQGMMFGYATDETEKMMPLPIFYAHRLMQRQAEVRKSGQLPWLGPDAKCQLSVRYEGDRPKVIETVVFSTQHQPDKQDIEQEVIENIIAPVIPAELRALDIQYLVNPSGCFAIGGPEADTGLTGRKIVVDTYGGSCPHGGGAFSGKDPTKVDRSGAYICRYIAKNLVAAGLASRCTVQVSYAIGQANPTSFFLNFHGTGQVEEMKAMETILDLVDLTPAGIIKRLDLRRPIYRQTAAYGHFGRPGFTWEETDLVDSLSQIG
ncbi:methionine adenosyltransferase [Desulfoferula mesophila]